MLSISTKKLDSRKTVLIDDVIYTVRKFSNSEQLDMSQYQRRIKELMELSAQEKLPEYDEEAEQIARALQDIYVRLFDDGGDQSKSKELISSLSYADISGILMDIFKEVESGKEG